MGTTQRGYRFAELTGTAADVPQVTENLATDIDADVENIGRLRRFQVTHAVTWPIADSVWTKLTYDAITATRTYPSGELTPPSADLVFPVGWGGIWDLDLSVTFDDDTTGTRVCRLTVDGAGVVSGLPTGIFMDQDSRVSAPNGLYSVCRFHLMNVPVAVTNKLQVYAWHNSGSSRNVGFSLTGRMTRMSLSG